MCGIVGIYNIDGSPIDNQELGNFTDSLAHRGPDGRGVYIDSNVSLGFGHRRLAILDLSKSGYQPMSFADRRYWIVLNGEIYNFIELRKELEGLGHQFRSDTDTEIILASYAEWGEACQFKFNGMWAFAIWDSQEHSLFLSRDRFGVKPLHYLYDGKHFIFASELKAFMALNSQLRPEIDIGIVALMGNQESAKETLLRGVKNLNGGHQLILRKDKVPAVKQWWRTNDHLVDVPRKFNDQVAQYKDLFFDACKIRMRSDVPICTALSGGIDSSSVLCTIAEIRSRSFNGDRLAEKWKQAFVFDYTDTNRSEKHYAKEVIHHVEAVPNYKEISLANISPEDIIQATFSSESIQEPGLGPWYTYREMRNKGMVVSMDGHGGDETLAGYEKYPIVAMRGAVWPWSANDRWQDLQSTLLGMYEKEVSDDFDKLLPSRLDIFKTLLLNKQRLKQSTLQLLQSSPSLYKILRSASRAIWHSQDASWDLIEGKTLFHLKEEQLSGHLFDHLNRELFYDFHIRILPRILRNFDRKSMAHGVEIRAPFLDWRLVSYAFSLPSNAKLGQGFTKLILREAMRGIIPERIRVRKDKIGFASPIIEWYKNALKKFVLDSINSKEFVDSEIWNGPVIKDYVEDCYRKKDYQNATRSWKYIQAMILMKAFREKSIFWNSNTQSK